MKRLLLTYIWLLLSVCVAWTEERTCDSYTLFSGDGKGNTVSAVQDPDNHCIWTLTPTPAVGYKFAYWQNFHGGEAHENPFVIRVNPSQAAVYWQAIFVKSNVYVYEWAGDSVIFRSDSTDIFSGADGAYAHICIEGEHIYSSNRNFFATDYGVWSKQTSGIADGNKYAGKHLHEVLFDDCDHPVAVVDTIVPLMIAGDSLASEISSFPANTDVQVFNGKSLTIDANTTIDGILDIHAGGKVVVSAGARLKAKGIIMRSDALEDLWPQLVVNGSITNLSNGNITINYDYTLDQHSYYPLTVPYDVVCSDITLPMTGQASFQVRFYDGAARAAGNNGWTVYDDAADGARLTAGKGYIMYAVPRKWKGHKQSKAVVRFPMVVDLSAGEPQKSVAVYYDDVAGEQTNKNWNFIGNPYLSDFTVSATADTAKLVPGYYVWNEGTGKYDLTPLAGHPDVRYITYSDDGYRSYKQDRIKGFTLQAFHSYFTQTQAECDALTFAKADRASSAPARRVAANKAVEDLEFGITLTQGSFSDHTGMLYGDYTDAYEINADLAKQFGSSQPMSLYTLSGSQALAYQAVSMEALEEAIPLGYRNASVAEATFAFDDTRYNRNGLEGVWLTDNYTGAVVNLLDEDYTFTPNEAQEDNRFYLTAKQKYQPQTPTDIDETVTETKIIHIYDMLGREMRNTDLLPRGVYVLVDSSGNSKRVIVQ